MGVFLSTIALAVLFVLLDRYWTSMQKNTGREYDNLSRSAVANWPLKVKDAIVRTKESRRKDGYTKVSDEDDADDEEDMPMSERIARDLYDEYESFEHECLVFLGANSNSLAGICIYLLDRNVEYFKQAVPLEYLNNFKAPKEEEQAAKACVLAGVEMWAPKWFSANAVHIICNHYEAVIEINKEGSLMHRHLELLVREGNFKPYIDWTDNFFCETNANEELWEGIIACGKRLLEHPNVEFDEQALIPWDELGPTESWNRTKVMLNHELLVSNARIFNRGNNFKCNDSENEDNSEDKTPLIDI